MEYMEKHTGKVRFGVVGTNFITDWVIAGARQDERFELVAVYSRRQETADAFAAKHQYLFLIKPMPYGIPDCRA